VTGVHRKSHGGDYCKLYLSQHLCRDDHINEGKMGGVCSTIANEKKCTYKVVVGTLEGKRTHGRKVRVNEGIILKWGLSKQTKKCEQDVWTGAFDSRRLKNVALKFRVS
jgi:hypothetical protein